MAGTDCEQKGGRKYKFKIWMLGSDEGGTEGGRAMWLKAGVDWHNQTWQKEVEQPLKAPPG